MFSTWNWHLSLSPYSTADVINLNTVIEPEFAMDLFTRSKSNFNLQHSFCLLVYTRERSEVPGKDYSFDLCEC